ncbi:tetratricopeptide repeat protein [Desulfovibrio inopinatus]|uniref:tetratricopeptide repeat protein n=1 Tax=Desulfovibrio inopinatus TaxID=102109 RepID=UPI000685FE30|nr:tetratricopeptide repeat protein [Desulfovibrio inopinatus]
MHQRRSHTVAFCFCVICLGLIIGACTPTTSLSKIFSAEGLSKSATADYYFLLYQDFQQAGDKEQARDVLEKLLAIAPTSQMYLELANLYWSLSEQDKSIETLRLGLKAFPNNKNLHFYLANAYLLQKDYEEASAVLKSYLDQKPHDWIARREMAAILIEAQKYEDALTILEEVPTKERNPAILYYLSRSNAGLGRQEEAVDYLKKALDKDPNMLAAWAELAYLYELDGDYAAAEEAYKRIMDLGEEGPEVWLRLVRLNLKMNNPDRALELIDNAPKDRSFLLESITAFLEEGYPQKADDLLTLMADDDRFATDVVFYRAILAYERDKDPRQALSYLQQIPSSHPQYTKSLDFGAQIALESDLNEKALELARQGSTIAPKNLDFLVLQAAALDKLGRLDEAADIMAQAAEQGASDTEILYRYGVILERAGKNDQALDVMEKIIALDPNHAEALNFVGYTLADRGQDLDRALELIQRALQSNPDSAYFIDSLAWAYYRKGDVKKAFTEIQRAVTQTVQDPIIWEHYGDIAKALGNTDEARKGYTKSLEMGPNDEETLRQKLKSL